MVDIPAESTPPGGGGINKLFALFLKNRAKISSLVGHFSPKNGKIHDFWAIFADFCTFQVKFPQIFGATRHFQVINWLDCKICAARTEKWKKGREKQGKNNILWILGMGHK